MIRIEILAVGKMRAGPMADLWQDYAGRMTWPFGVTEVEGRSPAEELKKLRDKIDPRAFLFVMDERGKSLRSLDFASRLDKLAAEGAGHIQFVIGGADGLNDEIRKKAGALLSLGPQTWPHMLVRVMLAEQIYRAQQILAGHPYHRE